MRLFSDIQMGADDRLFAGHYRGFSSRWQVRYVYNQRWKVIAAPASRDDNRRKTPGTMPTRAAFSNGFKDVVTLRQGRGNTPRRVREPRIAGVHPAARARRERLS